MKYRTLYLKDGKLRLIDQTLLPSKVEYIECANEHEVYLAIRDMKVRGAPAIGIAGAYGMAICTLIKLNGSDPKNWEETLFQLKTTANYLNAARPTAVNLSWATNRMFWAAEWFAKKYPFNINNLRKHLIKEANDICEEDAEYCESIGRNGVDLIEDGMGILTHCNAGSLATYELGTALAPIYMAHEKGIRFNVYVDETRPLLQGSRLTSWELEQSGINVTVVTDNCAAKLMADGRIDLVIVGADRISKQGDVANKIGTYGLAVLCKYHDIPMYVAAPVSTFDFKVENGSKIIIEMRDEKEISTINGVRVVSENVKCYNPAFDVTPHNLITGIITNIGLISPVDEDQVEKCFAI